MSRARKNWASRRPPASIPNPGRRTEHGQRGQGKPARRDAARRCRLRGVGWRTADRVGCSRIGAGKKPDRSITDPYPSTYRAYPAAPTAVRGVTVFDGEGGRVDDGTVLLADGQVERVGGPDLAIPEGYRVIDGTGKYLTPGVIDVHSHLGDYPSPSVAAHDDGKEATNQITPEVWVEHNVWPQDPGFTRAPPHARPPPLQTPPGTPNLWGGRSVG